MRTRRTISVARGAAGLASVAVLAVGARAEAANPPCTDAVNHPNPVFISGSTAAQAAFQALADALGSQISIIYQNPDSCAGLNDYLTGNASTESGVSNLYLDPVSGKGIACDLNATTPEVPDIGASDVFPATCVQNLGIGAITAANQIEVLGPIQAMTIAVPSGSNATSISKEAAQLVFGCDATASATGPCSVGATPGVISQWDVPTAIFTRSNTSGTLNMVAEAIGLPPASWANAAPAATPPPEQKSGTGGIFTALATATGTAVNAGISIISDEGLISNNAKATVDGGTGLTIKPLFYQHTGQSCGYLPDSTATTFDKLNVREGRYAIWGPVHFVVNKNASGAVTSPHAAAATLVLNYLIATGPTPSAFLPLPNDGGTVAITTAQKQALIDAEATPTVGGVVPWCAMHVARSVEVSANADTGEMSYQPPEPCGCHFEFVTTGATQSPYCKACNPSNVNADCNPEGGTSAYPVCRYGYCEVQ